MILSFLLLLLNSSFLSDTTFLRVMLLSCLHCCPWVATINSSVAKSRILPAFVSAPAPRVSPERKTKELFTQPLCSSGPSVCPAGSAPAGGPFRVLQSGWVDWAGKTEQD